MINSQFLNQPVIVRDGKVEIALLQMIGDLASLQVVILNKERETAYAHTIATIIADACSTYKLSQTTHFVSTK